MENYVGYGFNVYDISGKECLDFVARYDRDSLEDLLRFALEKEGITGLEMLTEKEKEKIGDLIPDWVWGEELDTNEYVKNIICRHENGLRLNVGGGGYIYYPPICFLDDADGKTCVRNRDDFERTIRKYFPDSDIVFGDIVDRANYNEEELHMLEGEDMVKETA